MIGQILRELRKAEGGCVPVAAFCRLLGISEQEVKKNIGALTDNGYGIALLPKGYALLSSPDRLYAPDILSRLPEGCICQRVESFATVDSTNNKAKQMAESGGEAGTLIIAEEQSAGRGRRGRGWESEPGVGIWMTLLLRPEIPPVKASGLTLLAALALTKAIQRVCGIASYIKWPNDVVIGGKKICGILTEMNAEKDVIRYVAVGIGINVNNSFFPEKIQETATSIYLQTGKKVGRCRLAAAWTEDFCQYYNRYVKEPDLSFVLEEYNSVLVNKDEKVCVYYGMAEQGKGEIGTARGIDRDGALLVETEEGIRRIVSGEVSVRGIYGYV